MHQLTNTIITNMHPHRQKSRQPHPHPKQTSLNKKYHFGNGGAAPDNQTPRFTLQALLANIDDGNTVTVVCNKRLNIKVDKGRRLSALLSDRKRKKKIGIAVGMHKTTLQDCLNIYAENNATEYILTSNPHHNYEHLQPRRKSISAKSRSTSETSIGKMGIGSNKHLPETNQKHPFSTRNLKAPVQDCKGNFASERKLGEQQMFAIQQRGGESVQSEREPMVQLKNNQEILREQIKNNLNSIASKYLQQVGNEPTNIEPYNEPIKPLLQPTKLEYAQKQNIDAANQFVQNRTSNERNVKEVDNPKFSFAEMMVKGMIVRESMKFAKQQSFKLVGDEQIQAQRKMAKQLMIPQGEMSSLADLSSIISCNLRQETKNIMEVDSIKNELEKINNYFPTKQEQTTQARVVNQQCKNNTAEPVQTQQKRAQPPRSYFAKYNLQDRMGPQTETIKLSPLRFRKKQQVVKQFVRARIVSKQSDSINIP